MTVEVPADPKVKAARERLVDLAGPTPGKAHALQTFSWRGGMAMTGDIFPNADLFGVDRAIAADMATIFAFLGQRPGAIYPDALGHREAMADLVEQWRAAQAVEVRRRSRRLGSRALDHHAHQLRTTQGPNSASHLQHNVMVSMEDTPFRHPLPNFS